VENNGTTIKIVQIYFYFPTQSHLTVILAIKKTPHLRQPAR